MNKISLKSLLISTIFVLGLTTNAFALSLDIEVDEKNNASLTVKDITESIYAIQVDLQDAAGNKGYTFTSGKNYFYEKMLETSVDNKTNITILIDKLNSYVITEGDLLVGVLSSTSKPNFTNKAKVTLVDENLKSTSQTVDVTVKYNEPKPEPEPEKPKPETPKPETPKPENPKPENPGGGGGPSGGSGPSGSGSPSGGASSGGSSLITDQVKPEIKEEKPEIKEEDKEEVQQVADGKLNIQIVKLPEIQADKVVKFNDTSSTAWAQESINKLAKSGIINGDGKGNFNPKGNSKRADVVVMLVKLLGIEGSATENFKDVAADKYYANYVGLAKRYGIVNGNGDNFNPEVNISRQDAMVMVSNILNQLEIKGDSNTAVLDNFKDAKDVSNYAKESIAKLFNLGIISGSNGNINPKAEITRAEMSVIISKIYDLILAEQNK